MALINNSYFYGDLLIPQKSSAAVTANLNWFINQYEEKYLTEILGYELYRDFKAGIEAATPDQQWIDLRDGKEFTDRNGTLTKWKGLCFGTYSPIANYVYYWYMRDSNTTTAGSGEVSANVSEPVSPAFKMIRAWNQMVQWNCELINFLDSNSVAYPQYSNNCSRRNLLITINRFGI